MNASDFLTVPKAVEELKKAKSQGAFKRFIEYIRFPHFKNLKSGCRIDFNFPVTALVGANGCGKSSVLQALFGAPDGYSTGLFWFSTSLDPINELSGERNCFIYGYKDNNSATVEVIKTRILWNKKGGSSKNPDYWEPSRPIKKHGMQTLPGGKRNPAIVMDVVQIDFRFQLSAFDRYFYLEDIQPWYRVKRKTKQDVLRAKSIFVHRSLTGEKSYGPKKADQVQTLSKWELDAIQAIVGKHYQAGKILRHKFYKEWGKTVQFSTESLNYSEANAGSGEVAVALIVQRLNEAKAGSLVLLDEPEYSLHPAAQKNLLRLLLTLSLRKQLQVIFTSHSPALLEGLPEEAIKVFETDASGQFVVQQNRLPEEAFVSIGHSITDRIIIRVEDALAKVMIEESLLVSNKDFLPLVEVQFCPGGSARIKEDIVLYSSESRRHLVLFDGDEFKHAVSDPSNIPMNQRTTQFMNEFIKQVTSCNIGFYPDGGQSGTREDQLVKMQHDYLNFWYQNVFFFPFPKLEDEVWHADLAHEDLVSVIRDAKDVNSEHEEIQRMPAKARFAALAKRLYTTADSKDILKLQTKFVKNWIKRDTNGFQQLVQLLKQIRAATSKSL